MASAECRSLLAVVRPRRKRTRIVGRMNAVLQLEYSDVSDASVLDIGNSPGFDWNYEVITIIRVTQFQSVLLSLEYP